MNIVTERLTDFEKSIRIEKAEMDRSHSDRHCHSFSSAALLFAGRHALPVIVHRKISSDRIALSDSADRACIDIGDHAAIGFYSRSRHTRADDINFGSRLGITGDIIGLFVVCIRRLFRCIDEPAFLDRGSYGYLYPVNVCLLHHL